MDLPPCNFRSVLPTLNPNQRPNIYRSNSLDDGTISSCLWLIDTVGIKSYVDLREDREYHEHSKLNQYFTSTHSKHKHANDDVKLIDNQTRITGNMFHIKFISFSYYLKVLAFRMTWSQVFNVFVLLVKHLFLRDYEYQRYGGGCYVNKLGLGRFYSILLEDCGSNFKSIFSVMTHKENFPVLISCSMGKDRTGIVSAILMQLVGCSDEEIINEYSESEKLLIPMKESIHKFFEERGVDTTFEGSPVYAMEEMLRCLKEKYGGSEGYLRHCGLSENDIDAIKRNIQHRTIDQDK